MVTSRRTPSYARALPPTAALALVLVLAGTVLAQPQLRTLGVDTTEANIPVGEVLSGGPPPQGIPALGFGGDWTGAVRPSPSPSYVSLEQASEWLADPEPVIAVTVNGATRLFPLQILTWHEIANTTVGDAPVAVSFCPLCNSALAFDRRIPLTETEVAELQAVNPAAAPEPLDPAFLERYADQGRDADALAGGVTTTFGVSGMLYNSNLLMFDADSSTLWSQILGQGNIGTLTGVDLLRYPAQIVAFAEARAAFPDADVLSRDTGAQRSYGRNPYVGYDRADTPPFLFSGDADDRLLPKERVVSVDRGEASVAYPFTVLQEDRVVNDVVAGEALTVFWQPGTASALDTASIASGADVGAVGVFLRDLGGRTLTFEWDGEAFVDAETGSRWNLLGQAVAGELAGSQLEPVVHDNTLWFAWAAFRPETRVYPN